MGFTIQAIILSEFKERSTLQILTSTSEIRTWHQINTSGIFEQVNSLNLYYLLIIGPGWYTIGRTDLIVIQARSSCKQHKVAPTNDILAEAISCGNIMASLEVKQRLCQGWDDCSEDENGEAKGGYFADT